jgi:hypothetical protein
MSAVISDERTWLQKKPVTGSLNPRQNSDVSHVDDDEPMTKADREEMAELREMVHQLAASSALNARSAPQVQVQTVPSGMAPTTKWLLASVALFSFLGGVGSFVGNSGIWIAKKDMQVENALAHVQKLEEQIEYLKTWNEKLRNNMAAYGWLIDNNGDVSRIEDKPVKRR